jgi:hypothetical protein
VVTGTGAAGMRVGEGIEGNRRTNWLIRLPGCIRGDFIILNIHMEVREDIRTRLSATARITIFITTNNSPCI